MTIGLIVAIETDAIFAYYDRVEQMDAPAGFDLYHIARDERDIYVLHTGMGEIAAAAGTQYLITRFHVDAIVNFGVVGGLTAGMKRQKTCVIERVVHYKYDCSEFLDLQVGQVDGHGSVFLSTDEALLRRALQVCPDLQRATCCSGDKFVGTEEEKAQISRDFSGDVCDMESAGIVLTCEANAVPCLLMKAVSDGLTGGAREFFEELQDAAFQCLRVTDAVIGSL